MKLIMVKIVKEAQLQFILFMNEVRTHQLHNHKHAHFQYLLVFF